MVGVLPLFAVEVLESRSSRRLRVQAADELVPREPPGPRRDHRLHAPAPRGGPDPAPARRFPPRERLQRVLRYMLDETEFLSPYGIRSVCRVHETHPYEFDVMGERLPGGLRPGRGEHRALRRELELARADLVPGQLPAGRGAGALPPLLRRRAARWNARSARAGCSTCRRWRWSSRRGWRASFLPDDQGRRPCHGTEAPLRHRSSLAGPDALLRVLPRRQRARCRRQPPDRVDRARGPLHRGPDPPPHPGSRHA